MKDRSDDQRAQGSLSRLQKVNLTDRKDAYFYIEVLDLGGREEVGFIDGIPLHQITDFLGELAKHLSSTFRLVNSTKVSVELELQFGIENGKLIGLVAKASGKATIKFTMNWENTASAANFS